MRARLVGYDGERPPVPPSELVPPIDPNPDPPLDPDDPSIPEPLTLVLEDGVDFHKLDYLALGYNRFDVLCIGGAGGSAGHTHEIIPDSAVYHYAGTPYGADLLFDSHQHWFGGGGGGGGIHRVKGRLALLPTVVPVVVGDPGADGGFNEVTSPFHDWRSGGVGGVYPPPAILSGGDGEASSFGGTICRASGGKGGVGTAGGAGGIGNAELPGGGALAGHDGTWNGVIGSGGGGGQGSNVHALGGDYASGGITTQEAGDGAVSASDPTTKGPAGVQGAFGLDYTRVVQDLAWGGSSYYLTGYNHLEAAHYDASKAVAAPGGGAKPFVLNGENVQYGSKAEVAHGLVVIRLTYVIT